MASSLSGLPICWIGSPICPDLLLLLPKFKTSEIGEMLISFSRCGDMHPWVTRRSLSGWLGRGRMHRAWQGFEIRFGRSWHTPHLWRRCSQLRVLCGDAWDRHACFRGLLVALRRGQVPDFQAEALLDLRCLVSMALGLASDSGQLTHPHSPWRYAFVQAIIQRSRDLDIPVGQWLQHLLIDFLFSGFLF